MFIQKNRIVSSEHLFNLDETGASPGHEKIAVKNKRVITEADRTINFSSLGFN